MKWKINPYVPKEGDTRTIRKFAWLPTDCGEYRVWLESYESVQKYKKMAQLGDGHGFWVLEWVEIERNYLVLYP